MLYIYTLKYYYVFMYFMHIQYMIKKNKKSDLRFGSYTCNIIVVICIILNFVCRVTNTI